MQGFWVDRYPVTNAEFRTFVRATGYVTTCERPPDPAMYPDADPALLVPGSSVFRKPRGPVDLRDNRIGGSLARLRTLIEARAERSEPGDPLRLDMLAALETGVFGPGCAFDRQHQMITPGRGGLFDACRERLALQHTEQVLRARANTALDTVRAYRAPRV